MRELERVSGALAALEAAIREARKELDARQAVAVMAEDRRAANDYEIAIRELTWLLHDLDGPQIKGNLRYAKLIASGAYSVSAD